MLIINADDLGLNNWATDATISCYRKGCITSASAMMFMADSERSAELALEVGLDAGLHVNFTVEFDDTRQSDKLRDFQADIGRYLRRSKYSVLVYNPFLRNKFKYVYGAQYEEYVRLYRRDPTHVDGHHHMHLCMNMMFDKIIPKGSKVRRTFYFAPGEKGRINRLYRHVLAMWLGRRNICTDLFFSIGHLGPEELQKIVKLAEKSDVELMVHPERAEEYACLMSEEYLEVISGAVSGSYAKLKK